MNPSIPGLVRALAGGAAVLLAGCGGSATVTVSGSPTATAGAASPTSSAVASTPAPVSPIATPAPPAATPAPPVATPAPPAFVANAPCQSAQLRVGLDKVNPPAATQPSAFFAFTNVSSTPCTMTGYPGFQAYTSSGQLIPVTVALESSYEITDPGRHLVSLAPGVRAFFGVGWTDVNHSDGSFAGCLDAASVKVVAPGTTTTLTVPAALQGICPYGTQGYGVQLSAVALATAFVGGERP